MNLNIIKMNSSLVLISYHKLIHLFHYILLLVAYFSLGINYLLVNDDNELG